MVMHPAYISISISNTKYGHDLIKQRALHRNVLTLSPVVIIQLREKFKAASGKEAGQSDMVPCFIGLVCSLTRPRKLIDAMQYRYKHNNFITYTVTPYMYFSDCICSSLTNQREEPPVPSECQHSTRACKNNAYPNNPRRAPENSTS